MRSSLIAAFRSIVMLATVAVLLSAAFLYNSPERRTELLESIAQSRWLSGTLLGNSRGQDRFTPASPQPLAEAPSWQPNPSRHVAMPPAAAWSLDADTSQLPGELGVQAPPVRHHDPAVQAAGYEYLPEASSSGHRKGDDVRSPFHSPRAMAARPANKLDFHGPDSPGSRGDVQIASQSDDGPAEGIGPQHTRTDAGRTDRFTRIERRLRELGATYYLLESRGTESDLFRFHCRMAIGGARHHNRHFEATDKDPIEAMNRVLREVERWRLSRGL